MTAATDNDDTYLESDFEAFQFAASKPLLFETRLTFTEANTDDAIIVAGLIDGVAADAMQDAALGPKASYSGAVFFKVDGATVWNCESSVAGDQVTTTTTVTAIASSRKSRNEPARRCRSRPERFITRSGGCALKS